MAERTCPKCFKVTDAPEGSAVCPEYHGRLGNGFCPLFVDGQSAVETAQLYYDCLMRTHDEVSELTRKLREAQHSGFFARLFGFA